MDSDNLFNVYVTIIILSLIFTVHSCIKEDYKKDMMLIQQACPKAEMEVK